MLPALPRPTEPPLTAGGAPWLGANFWSRLGGPLMWRTFDPGTVRGELRVLAEHGLTMTRSFFFWPDFHPEPERIDEQMCERYAQFLDLHREAGLRTVPTFIVGHMSGQNWDPAWRQGRDLYRDVWLVSRQAWFITQMVSRFHRHDAVVGWLISNEMPLYGGGGGPMVSRIPGATARDVTAWAQLMVQAVRAAGATQPVSLGDGAWGREITGSDNGFRIRELAGLQDWLGPHAYHMSDDTVRQHLIPAATVDLLSGFGRPVVLEEFGLTTDFSCEEAAADYYRQILHTTLLAGATGWVAWNNTDFELPDQDPYRHHPFEMHFGITRTDGKPKPPIQEMRRFRDLLEEIDLPNCRRASTHAAIVVSSYLEGGHPLTSPADIPAVRDALVQSYVTARLAGLAPAILRELDGIRPARLLIVPSVKALTAPGWRALAEAAAAGATVLVTYSCGETPSQRGPWWPDLDRLFGVRKLLRYGLVTPVTDDIVTWEFGEQFGDLPRGARLRFRAAGTRDGRCMLPLEATSARVIAHDSHGRPALVSRDTGAGRLLLATYPLEYFAARTPQVNPDDTVRLYRAAALLAGAEPPVSLDDPRVLTDVLEHADGRRFAIAASQAPETLTAAVRVSGARLRPAAGGGPAGTITLEPYGVALMHLDPAPAAQHPG